MAEIERQRDWPGREGDEACQDYAALLEDVSLSSDIQIC